MPLSEKILFLQFVRFGIGHQTEATIKSVDWQLLEALAMKQGLSAIVLDGIDAMRKQDRGATDSLFPSQKTTLRWIGNVVQNYEERYKSYKKAISGLASFYNSHGYKMMVLKGYACSLYWPRPDHRPCGDIDIWQFGYQKEADTLLQAQKGISIDNSHHHHSVFQWGRFTVENHYDFLNVHRHKSNVELEKTMKKLAKDDTHYVDVDGERIYLPSVNLHALFLQRHAMAHFAATELTLRQILDWGFFAKANAEEIDWKWLETVLNTYGMGKLFAIFNAICVEDLGFASRVFPNLKVDLELKNRVLDEILRLDSQRNYPKRIIPRIVYKWKRWKENEWKHNLCYNESMWSSFWSGVRSHLMKPSSI